MGRGGAGAEAVTASGQSWPSVARDPDRVKWSALDSGYRGAVARDAGDISAVPDLPPPIPAVGAHREAGRSAEATGAASAPAGKAESGRSVRGCNLRERQKGGLAVGPTRRGKGTKIIAVAAGNSLPLAVSVDSASPAECQLVEYVLAGSFLDQLPVRLVGDKAYDSDPLDRTLQEEYGIEMIAPNRRGRKCRTQDGRKLRRYRKRWKVERLFAWMHNFRRLVTRWEYHVENFLGFVHLACLHMLLRHL
jgi:transposase